MTQPDDPYRLGNASRLLRRTVKKLIQKEIAECLSLRDLERDLQPKHELCGLRVIRWAAQRHFGRLAEVQLHTYSIAEKQERTHNLQCDRELARMLSSASCVSVSSSAARWTVWSCSREIFSTTRCCATSSSSWRWSPPYFPAVVSFALSSAS